jgi:hypothetical protein
MANMAYNVSALPRIIDDIQHRLANQNLQVNPRKEKTGHKSAEVIGTDYRGNIR